MMKLLLPIVFISIAVVGRCSSTDDCLSIDRLRRIKEQWIIGRRSNLTEEIENNQDVECGIEGTQSEQGNRWPWAVILFIDDAWTCHGTLVSPRHILTSGNCVFGATFVDVVAGAFDIDDLSEEGQVWATSYNAFPHKDFDGLSNNIGLVVLEDDIQFNQYVKPACLPIAGDTLEAEDKLTGMGWITGPTLETFEGLSVLSRADCTAVSGGAEEIGCTQPTTFCGTSGVPLVEKVVSSSNKEEGEKWQLAGFVTMGPSSGCGTAPTGFERTEYFLGWIQEQISK